MTYFDLLHHPRFFASILRNAVTGAVELHDGAKTWLYHGTRDGASTCAQEMDVDTLMLGSDEFTCKYSDEEDNQAAGHLVLKVTDHLYVMFYTQFEGGLDRSIRAAVSSSPNGVFIQVPGFEVTPAASWEKFLETTSSWVYISDTPENLQGWVGYETANGRYLFGWLKVWISKRTGDIVLLERNEHNPLIWLIPPHCEMFSIGFGTGPDTFHGQHVGYYASISPGGLKEIWRAFSPSPLFEFGSKEMVAIDDMPFEAQPEKFSWYVRGKKLYLFYEYCGLNDWRTRVRVLDL